MPSRHAPTSYLLCLISILFCSLPLAPLHPTTTSDHSEPVDLTPPTQHELIINDIIVKGNKHISTQAILQRLPFKKGAAFDPFETGRAIHLLYALGNFSQIQLEYAELPDNKIDLYVLIVSKKLLDTIKIKGAKALAKRKLLEHIKADKITAIDNESAQRLCASLKKYYQENNYHMTQIDFSLMVSKAEPDKAQLHITINEGPKSMVTRVTFKGNHAIPDRKLSNVIFTREQWLLGFLSEAGRLDNDRVEMDKHYLEYFYRDHGYLQVRVVDAQVSFSKDKREVTVTFEIQEGDVFTLGTVRVLGDDIFTDEELQRYVFLQPGEVYSQRKMVDTINALKAAWGQRGYIYADVYPDVIPNEEDKTVDIVFKAERGEKLYANRIDITGNRYTRDKVIRRELTFDEGDLITSTDLEASKRNVDFLSYFERDGVNWKIHRLTNGLADLELNIQEARTGSFNFNLAFGSDQHSSSRSLKGAIQVAKNNLFGRGWDVQAMVQGNIRTLKEKVRDDEGNILTDDFGNPKERFKGIEPNFQRFNLHFYNPYLFDTNVSGGFDVYTRREEYTEWRRVDPIPIEKVVGAQVQAGFLLPSIDSRLSLLCTAGIESIEYNGGRDARGNSKRPTAFGPHADLIQARIDRAFKEGTMTWLETDLLLDTRNHKIYPNEGHRIFWATKVVPPFLNKQYSLFKSEFEASWFTSLIGIDDLVLGLRLHGGLVRNLDDDKPIPYKELFHMGGQSTVRGFVWGGIEPALQGEPIGGRNMVLFNAELTFPLLSDYSMKAHVFYDAGAGWDTPKECLNDVTLLRRDKFNLRHSIGFGVNLMQPQPVKIDWGYKLDRDRDSGESSSEWHISMNAAW